MTRSRGDTWLALTGDPRWTVLARLLELDVDTVRGRVQRLWMSAIESGSSDVPKWLAASVLGEKGPSALVDSLIAVTSRSTSGLPADPPADQRTASHPS